MKTLILILLLLFSFQVFGNHLETGQLFSCKVLEHRSISPTYGDKFYPNQPKNFQFKVKIIDEKGGILELSKKAKELIVEDFLVFEFADFHSYEESNPEDVADIKGKTQWGSFEFEDSIFVMSSSFAKLQSVEYIFASCDSF